MKIFLTILLALSLLLSPLSVWTEGPEHIHINKPFVILPKDVAQCLQTKEDTTVFKILGIAQDASTEAIHKAANEKYQTWHPLHIEQNEILNSPDFEHLTLEQKVTLCLEVRNIIDEAQLYLRAYQTFEERKKLEHTMNSMDFDREKGPYFRILLGGIVLVMVSKDYIIPYVKSGLRSIRQSIRSLGKKAPQKPLDAKV